MLNELSDPNNDLVKPETLTCIRCGEVVPSENPADRSTQMIGRAKVRYPRHCRLPNNLERVAGSKPHDLFFFQGKVKVP